MRKSDVFVHDVHAGVLEEIEKGMAYRFTYLGDYDGPPASLTLPVSTTPYDFEKLPGFFEGLLPEGYNLEILLRVRKIDRNDLFSQLMAVGMDMVGAVTVQEIE